jgi:hypothetical protein
MWKKIDRFLWNSGYFLILDAEYITLRFCLHPEKSKRIILNADIIQLTTA